MSSGVLALIIFVAILLQVVIVLLLGFLRRKRQYLELNTEGKTLQVITNTSPVTKAVHSGLAWEEFREFVVQRKVFEANNHSVCSFYLIPRDGIPLPAFKPGQFLIFKLFIEGSCTAKQKSVIRCYTLSDAPRSDYYRVSIKRVHAPANQPNIPAGLSSNFFHDAVEEGARLLVKAPSGHFHLQRNESLPIVLIGGGIGITPMLSIINAVLEGEENREIWLYYGVRNGDEHTFKEHLQTLANKHDNFHLHVCYSAPGDNDAEGIDYRHNSRVNISLLRATLKLMRYQFYVCGPKLMMESLVPDLEDWGVDRNDIYYESFGPASLIKREKLVPTANAKAIIITFSKSGKNIPWDPAADSLLEFAESNDIEVDSGCRAGGCGSCQTKVKSGEFDYSQEPDADVAPGHCLLCISTPKCDLTLDV
ncbi:MAG: 2Fe-2S iron-sulfur cluster-binding protein [Colwellia sp.]|nr:2Fe-2S iron-sulfur cluster-binding protein [Colwellia sp.]